MSDNFLLPEEIRKKLAELHASGKTVVFVSGVFDLLHQEHKNFLQKARALGDVLFVAIESDVRVRQLKGEGRPVNSQEMRKKAIEAQKLADIVFILPEDFSSPAQHIQIIQEVWPDFLAVSSHTSHLDKKRAIVEAAGGELVIVHQHNPAVSTTQILNSQAQP